MTTPKSLLDIFTSGRHPLSSIRKMLPPLPGGESQFTTTPPHFLRIRHNSHTLLIIRHPGKKDVNYLKRKYGFHPLHLEDVVSPIQRPKIDFEKNYIFFVFHYPLFNPNTLKIESKEIDFFLLKDDVIIILEHEFPAISEIIKNISKKRNIRSKFFEKGTGLLLYHLFDALIDTIFPLLEQLEKGLEEIDNDVFIKESKYTAEKISFLRRNIIFFQSIVRPTLSSFSEIEDINHPLVDEELETHFTNIIDHLKKINDRLQNLNELSHNLSSAFESYLSFKTNEIIKVLTIFSVVLLPLTLLSSIYGMNLNILPLADHPAAFFILGVFMLSIVAMMLAAFKWKRWI